MTQGEREELKRLAEACIAAPSVEFCSVTYADKWPCERNEGHAGCHKNGGFQWKAKDEKRPTALSQFRKRATPGVLLGVLAENQRMREGGVGLIAAERQRQVSGEGWTAAHDDGHDSGQMAQAAAVYAQVASNQIAGGPVALEPSMWPWESKWYKPYSDPIRNLAKAGALIAAEIDRLQRERTTNAKGGEA
jgi:hypothetical protein